MRRVVVCSLLQAKIGALLTNLTVYYWQLDCLMLQPSRLVNVSNPLLASFTSLIGCCRLLTIVQHCWPELTITKDILFYRFQRFFDQHHR